MHFQNAIEFFDKFIWAPNASVRHSYLSVFVAFNATKNQIDVYWYCRGDLEKNTHQLPCNIPADRENFSLNYNQMSFIVFYDRVFAADAVFRRV